MINTTQTNEKKRRGIGSLLNNLSGRKMNESESPALAPVIGDSPIQNERLSGTLNRIIAAGVNFDVSAKELTVCRDDLLTGGDRRFIETNQAAILCTLQQNILTRDVFAGNEQKLREFEFDVFERQAIIGENESDESTIYFDAVCEVSKRWFAELLSEI